MKRKPIKKTLKLASKTFKGLMPTENELIELVRDHSPAKKVTERSDYTESDMMCMAFDVIYMLKKRGLLKKPRKTQ